MLLAIWDEMCVSCLLSKKLKKRKEKKKKLEMFHSTQRG